MMPDKIEREKHSSDVGGGSLSDDDIAMQARFNEAHQGIMGMLFAAYKMRGRELRAAERSLPLTVIGGFLGSGKTTLLNHLLVSSHGRKLVVLVNDFGRINIDASLVASQTDDLIKLSNGCACCAVSADLTNNLIEIAEREDPPEAIVLEASGIADPNGVIQIVLSNPAIRLDGSLVVVDAETIQDFAEDPLISRLFHNQIAAADLIVLSKVDLVDKKQRASARDWLATHYPEKRVIEAAGGNVPAEVVLGIDATHEASSDPPVSTDHAHDFASVSITIDEPLDGDRLQAVFDSLPKSLLRVKGVLCLADNPGIRTIYQRVGARWSYTPTEPWGDEKPHSSLVFIGPTGSLDRSKLRAEIDACRLEGGAALSSSCGSQADSNKRHRRRSET